MTVYKCIYACLYVSMNRCMCVYIGICVCTGVYIIYVLVENCKTK